MKRIVFFILLFFFLFLQSSIVYAQGIKPDIRNYDVLVDSRPMPSQPCLGRTPEQWVAAYVGFNTLSGDNMKFSDDIFEDGNQLEKITERLTPYNAKQLMNKTMDEPGNQPTWVGEICWYQGGLKPPIIGSKLIVAQNPITTAFKKIRFGNHPLSAYIARGHLALTGGVYNTQKTPLVPDPQKQSACPVKPPGTGQGALTDKGEGENRFSGSLEDLKVDLACTVFNFVCQCQPTRMYIRTDSTIQYNTDPLCRGVGCTEEELGVVDPASRASEESQDSGGWINAQVRPGLMDQIVEMVKALFSSVTGIVPEQKTRNRVNTQSAPSSYFTTKALEVGMDFLNCKLFPYAKRSEMPECNTNWLANLIGNITNQLRGQNIAEPNEATPSSVPSVQP